MKRSRVGSESKIKLKKKVSAFIDCIVINFSFSTSLFFGGGYSRKR